VSTTVWLARIAPNMRNRHARGDMGDAAKMHRRMMTFCGADDIGPGARAKIGMLYRVERGLPGPTVLVQFRARSLALRLPPGYGRVDALDLEPLLGKLHAGQRVRYRITANPSARRRRQGGDGRGADFFDSACGAPPPGDAAKKRKRGAVVPLAGVDADRWWETRAAECGLTLLSTTATPQGGAVGRDENDKIVIRHVLVQFDGTAAVRDLEALRQAVLVGVGRGKPYGAGLLSLAPGRV
jgi:CRISPR system Cascade subunit CasE